MILPISADRLMGHVPMTGTEPREPVLSRTPRVHEATAWPATAAKRWTDGR
jgi:hypothetical protein